MHLQERNGGKTSTDQSTSDDRRLRYNSSARLRRSSRRRTNRSRAGTTSRRLSTTARSISHRSRTARQSRDSISGTISSNGVDTARLTRDLGAQGLHTGRQRAERTGGAARHDGHERAADGGDFCAERGGTCRHGGGEEGVD